MTGFGDAIVLFYRNFATFRGRSMRSEYWWPVLMQLIVYTGLIVVLLSWAGSSETGAEEASGPYVSVIIAIILFSLVNFLPNLSLQVRRFHDLNQSGWLVLAFIVLGSLVPGAGLAQMIWFAFRGTDGPNQYGLDPFSYDVDIFG